MINPLVEKFYPTTKTPWVESTEAKIFEGHQEKPGDVVKLVTEYAESKQWKWPDKKLYFFSDLHGDREAFLRSLLATGEFEVKKGKLKLSKAAKKSKFVIGGDMFDKGPSNLKLLDLIKELIDSGADVDLIAGNHDIRTFIGIHFMGHKGIKTAHLFTRVGGKSLLLFKEIFVKYKKSLPKCPHSEEELVQMMFPDAEWMEEFPVFARKIIHPEKLKKELKRINEKIIEIQEATKSHGMTLRDIWSCVIKARELFLKPKGEYHWVFDKMELAKIYGSFVFVHGGLDDEILPHLFEKSAHELKVWFHKELREDAFDLYHGPIGNCFRTKYRPYDHPLTRDGVATLHRRGIYAIVHGHLNQLGGQRLVFRNNLLHFQCDCSLDSNTRVKEALDPPGMAVTIFHPEGFCEAVSSDYNEVKVFSTQVLAKKEDFPKEAKKMVKKEKKNKKEAKKSSKKVKFNHESIEDQQSIIKYFEAISEGFANGNLEFGTGNKIVSLTPQGLVKLNINAGKKGKKIKLNLELEWKEGDAPEKPTQDLTINTDNDDNTGS